MNTTVTEYQVTRVHHVVLSNIFPGYADHYVADATSVVESNGNGQGTGGQTIHFRADAELQVGARIRVTVEVIEP